MSRSGWRNDQAMCMNRWHGDSEGTCSCRSSLHIGGSDGGDLEGEDFGLGEDTA